MHTTLGLIRAGWKTVYHHQTLAVGLAPATAEQYLLQRRRWGMGSMQVLAHEKLWAAKRWLSWRNYYEYLTGTLWWLEGVATLFVFIIPLVILLSGAADLDRGPARVRGGLRGSMFTLRMWGTRRLFRGHLHWPTAFALRIFRVPIGISCLWWLLTRRDAHLRGDAQGRRRRAGPRPGPPRAAGPDRRRHRDPGVRRGRRASAWSRGATNAVLDARLGRLARPRRRGR